MAVSANFKSAILGCQSANFKLKFIWRTAIFQFGGQRVKYELNLTFKPSHFAIWRSGPPGEREIERGEALSVKIGVVPPWGWVNECNDGKKGIAKESGRNAPWPTYAQSSLWIVPWLAKYCVSVSMGEPPCPTYAPRLRSDWPPRVVVERCRWSVRELFNTCVPRMT